MNERWRPYPPRKLTPQNTDISEPLPCGSTPPVHRNSLQEGALVDFPQRIAMRCVSRRNSAPHAISPILYGSISINGASSNRGTPPPWFKTPSKVPFGVSRVSPPRFCASRRDSWHPLLPYRSFPLASRLFLALRCPSPLALRLRTARATARGNLATATPINNLNR
jgi:hypothetical protein